MRAQPFPVSPFNLALYLKHLLELTNSSSLIKEGAICLSAKEFHRKDALETNHLKSLAIKINFHHLLQLRNFVTFVLSFSGFMRASEVLIEA